MRNGGRSTASTPALTKQERVYRALREGILSGAYGPGHRLVIDSLATELGVSALPVREAIRRLEAEGLVVFRPNAGAHVAPANPRLFEEELTVLAVLEGYATALAAPHLDERAVSRLSALDDAMEEAIEQGDPLAFGRLNQEFHGLVYEHCPNDALVELLRDVARRLDSIRRTVFVQIPYREAESLAEHRRLMELIAARASAAEIEAAARAHKLGTVASFQSWLSEEDGIGRQT